MFVSTVPPRWRLEPNDVAVAAGQDVTLQCQADGYPKPTITWKKAVGKKKTKILYSTENIKDHFHSENVFLNNIYCKKRGHKNWVKFETGNTPGEYKDFMFEGSSRVLENGSLVFERVAKDSEGHYLCEARNDIGAGLSKLIFLKVNGKYHPSDKMFHLINNYIIHCHTDENLISNFEYSNVFKLIKDFHTDKLCDPKELADSNLF